MSQASPTTEPLTLAEAKKHLEIADADPTHDAHVTGLISASREVWEHDTQSITTPRTVTEHHYQTYERMRLSVRPVISVTSISMNGNALTNWTFDAPRRMIHFDGYQQSVVSENWQAVEIVYQAGYADAASVPALAKQAMKLQLDLMFQPEKLIRHHAETYERLVKRALRPTYP